MRLYCAPVHIIIHCNSKIMKLPLQHKTTEPGIGGDIIFLL
jgi:hypothetical protein